jgi:hypothetical protein
MNATVRHVSYVVSNARRHQHEIGFFPDICPTQLQTQAEMFFRRNKQRSINSSQKAKCDNPWSRKRNCRKPSKQR